MEEPGKRGNAHGRYRRRLRKLCGNYSCISDPYDHGGVKNENTMEFLSFRYSVWKDL